MERRTLLSIGAIVVTGVLAGVMFFGCGRAPQMGADEDTFRAVDALYTAVTARNEKLLKDCEKRLHGLKESGKLPPEAATQLDGIIATARSGRWQPAAERLHAFMSAQRRK
jgi:hypothetical protein